MLLLSLVYLLLLGRNDRIPVSVYNLGARNVLNDCRGQMLMSSFFFLVSFSGANRLAVLTVASTFSAMSKQTDTFVRRKCATARPQLPSCHCFYYCPSRNHFCFGGDSNVRGMSLRFATHYSVQRMIAYENWRLLELMTTTKWRHTIGRRSAMKPLRAASGKLEQTESRAKILKTVKVDVECCAIRLDTKPRKEER